MQKEEQLKRSRAQREYKQFTAGEKSRLQAKVGKQFEVLVDEVHDNGAVGRSHADAPEIDGIVNITDGQRLAPGALVQVLIEGADEYDLNGTVVG